MPKKVLLIEYEPRYVERVRKLLTPMGHTITEAHDGEAGLTAFGASKFDLVLLSGMLPRLPSAEVIREIRKKGGATAPPIILMMTGYRGDNPKADAQKVGAFDILARPFTDESSSRRSTRRPSCPTSARRRCGSTPRSWLPRRRP